MSTVNRRVFLGGASASLAIPTLSLGRTTPIFVAKKPSKVSAKNVVVKLKSGKTLGNLMSVPDEDVDYMEDKDWIVFEPPFRVKPPHGGKTKLRFHKIEKGNTFVKASFTCEEETRKTIQFDESDLSRLVLKVTIGVERTAKLGAVIPTSVLVDHECCLYCDNVLYCSSEPFCIECDGLFLCSCIEP